MQVPKGLRVLNQYYGDYITIAVFIATGGLLVAGAVGANKLLAPKAPGGQATATP